jgi:membrane protease YdiL (CAAX protease family)
MDAPPKISETSKRQRRPLPDHLRVPWGAWAAAVFVVLWVGSQFLLGIVLVLTARVVPAMAVFLKSVRAEAVGPSFALNLVSAAMGLLLLWAFLRHYKVGWRTLGWRRTNFWRSLLYVAIIIFSFLILFQVALSLADKLIPGFDPNQAQNNEFTKNPSSHFNLSLIALVLIPPVVEESIFRGFIFPALSKRLGLIGGAVLSSFLFGLAHGQANVFIYTFILGLFLCFMYVRLRSIFPGMVLHMLNNLLALWAISSR